MDEDENEHFFDDEISDEDEMDEIHPEDMSDAMRTLNQALIDADDVIDEKSRDIDQSVFDEMIDIFGSKVLSKLKNKNRKQPDCSQGHVQFEFGNYIYLVGGYIDHFRLGYDDHDQQYVKLRDVWRYDLRTEEWWLICAFGPQAILNLGLCGSAGSAIRTGSGPYLYMLFGFERRACDTNQILRFSLQDYRWERVKCVGDKPLARNKHGCFNYKDEIIGFGGFGPRAANPFADSSEINDDGQGFVHDMRSWNNDLFSFDTKTSKYSKITDVGSRPSPRAAFGFAQTENVGFIFGGRCASGRQNDFHRFDFETRTWSLIKPTGPRTDSPCGRSWLSLVYNDNSVLVYGGLDKHDRALNDCWRFDLNSTEWSEIQLKITESVLLPKMELRQRLGPNRRHSLGSTDETTRGDSQKYMRMWHTSFFNKYNGKMMICGGTNSQNSFYRNLPPVFLLKVTVPSLFHLVRNDLGSNSMNQISDPQTIQHISKWTNSEIAKIDYSTEIRKLRTSFISRLIQIEDSEFSKLPRRYQNQQIIWKKENKIYAMMPRENFISNYIMGRQLALSKIDVSSIDMIFFPDQTHFIDVMMHKLRGVHGLNLDLHLRQLDD